MSGLIKAYKANSIAERYLLQAFTNGTFPPGTIMPAERELADIIGVTRTTLREVTGRLSREGWINIRHGRPTRVNDYNSTLHLSALDSLVTLDNDRAHSMVDDLFALMFDDGVRYFTKSIGTNVDGVRSLLGQIRASLCSLVSVGSLYTDSPLWNKFVVSFEMQGFYLKDFKANDEYLKRAYISFLDYYLFQQMALLSGNTILSLSFNGIKDFYLRVMDHYYLSRDSVALLYSFVLDLMDYVDTYKEGSCLSYSVMKNYSSNFLGKWDECSESFYVDGLEYKKG